MNDPDFINNIPTWISSVDKYSLAELIEINRNLYFALDTLGRKAMSGQEKYFSVINVTRKLSPGDFGLPSSYTDRLYEFTETGYSQKRGILITEYLKFVKPGKTPIYKKRTSEIPVKLVNGFSETVELYKQIQIPDEFAWEYHTLDSAFDITANAITVKQSR